MRKAPSAARSEQATGGGRAVEIDSAELLDRVKRLDLDNEDLRFEAARLKASLIQAEAENRAISERNAALQLRLDRINKLTPRWMVRVIKPLMQRILP